MNKRTIHDLAVHPGQRVLIRVDYNVPLTKDGQVREDTRIRGSLPTLKKVLDQKGCVILASHLGRPKGQPDPQYSLAPVAVRLSQLLGQSVGMAPDCIGPEVASMVAGMQPGEVLMLENLRFHKGEEANDPNFAEQLACLAEVIVNDAFGTAHRGHASNFGVAKFGKPMIAGCLMADEIRFFNQAVLSPEHPVAAILGGSKVSTKIGVIQSLLGKVDKLLIGGGMAYTFFQAMGIPVGNSLVEPDMVLVAAEALAAAQAQGVEILLPVDAILAERLAADAEVRVQASREVPDGWMGLDIGAATVAAFGQALIGVKTILWNGPMGVFELAPFAHGTVALAQLVAKSGALTVVGGGDTDAAIRQAGVADQISYISTGGGAFLEMLEGREMPGVACLDEAG